MGNNAVLSLGFSYLVGQSDWAHQPAPPPDPKYPYWPDRSVWIDWLTQLADIQVFDSDNFYFIPPVPKGPYSYNPLGYSGPLSSPQPGQTGAWDTTDLSLIEQWLLLHSGGNQNGRGVLGGNFQNYTPDYGDVLHAIYRVLQTQGPLPQDATYDLSQLGHWAWRNSDGSSAWSESDGVDQEFQFFYYQFDWAGSAHLITGDDWNNLVTSSSLRMQVAGHATKGDNQSKLILPNAQSVDIVDFTLTSRGSDGSLSWQHNTTPSDWAKKHWDIISGILAAVVIVTIIVAEYFTGGAVSPLAIAAIEELASLAATIVYTILTGDTSKLVSALINLFTQIVQAEAQAETGANIDAQKLLDKFKADNPQMTQWVNDMGNTVIAVYKGAQQIIAQAQQIANVAVVDVNSIFQAAHSLGAPKLQFVSPDIWGTLEGHVMTPMVMSWWKKVKAVDPSNPQQALNAMLDIESKAPGYAQGAVQIAAMLKSVEVVQTQAMFTLRTPKVTKISRPPPGDATAPGSIFPAQQKAQVISTAYKPISLALTRLGGS